LNSLDSKLTQLKRLQDQTISVAERADNEPARLEYSQGYIPKQIKFLNDVEQVQLNLNHPGGKSKEGYLTLHLAVAKAEAALGLFVVDGKEADASEFRRRLARVRYALQYFEYLSASTESLMPQVDELERVSDQIVIARQSSKNNLAWHNIRTKVTPLAEEIARDLATISDYEVARMRDRVGQVATWTRFMSVGSLLTLFILFGIALFLTSAAAKRISTPVTQLFRATEELRNGNYNQRLQPSGVLEVQGLLCTMRNRMAGVGIVSIHLPFTRKL